MEEETKEVKEEKQDIMQDVKKKTEEIMKTYIDKELNTDDLEILGGLVDIHKDISNEEYWKRKENINMYGNYGRGNYGNYGANYGNYNGRVPSRGAYGEGYSDGYGEYEDSSYGRRGRDSRYRGDDHLDRMYQEYGRYEDSRSRYGAGKESNEAYRYMTESLKDFTKYLFETAETPQQKQMLREALQQSMM